MTSSITAPNLTDDERREIVRRGHTTECTLHYAGSPLALTGLQALDMLEHDLAPDSQLAIRLAHRLRDEIAS